MSDGILIIDKPLDFTSFDVCAVMRGLLKTRKIGHTGTLDPMATGVLPVLVGKATKACDLLPDHDKEYVAGFRLGVETTTLDIWGEILKEEKVFVDREKLLSAMENFKGEITQLPPMYSAVSVGGRRLYDIARSGETVERPTRLVTVKKLELLSFDEKNGEGEILCRCSKGTYIRTLVADIGTALGVGGAITSLRRTSACGYDLSAAITLDEAKRLCAEGKLEERILPTGTIFESYRMVEVSEPQAVRVRNGGALSLERLSRFKAQEDGEIVRLISPSGEFLALGTVMCEAGEIKIKKQF